ncbi:hypothetical protein LDENG_00131260 [Lucifuga dentata]|nr:hypothetical protein LDENG_00131260 [Lucifuga dentata]
MSHNEDNDGKKSSHHTELYASIPRTCMPIIYHPDYNITFMGLEKLHPFDAGKWGKVIHFLEGETLRSSMAFPSADVWRTKRSRAVRFSCWRATEHR